MLKYIGAVYVYFQSFTGPKLFAPGLLYCRSSP